jgi:hypothetical protein
MMSLIVTDDELRGLYEDTYYAITHEKNYETWRDEKIAKGIVVITSETH